MKLNNEITKLISKYNVEVFSIFSFENEHNHIIKKDLPAFEKWLNDNANAEMQFLKNNIEVRKDPDLILKNVKNAIIFLFPYSAGHRVRGKSKIDSDNLNFVTNENSIISKKLISRYVFGKDYHKVIKKYLNNISSDLNIYFNDKYNFRAVVDSVPFFDRAYARESGIGFVGKNTMLIRPGMGSFFFIATLLTTAPIELLKYKSENFSNRIFSLDCGDCQKCLDSCPTQAFKKPYYLDANRCLSYLTIEHRNLVSEEYIPFFSNTIYGCDICQEVCPYNFVTSDFKILNEFSNFHKPFLTINVKDIALMDMSQYEKWFGGTAATRAKYEGLVRNALYHLHATSSPDINEVLNKLEFSSYEIISRTVKQIRELKVSKDK
jgi:epoxyqueuosine reductase